MRNKLVLEAEEMWRVGRQLGIEGNGKDSEIINKLVGMEIRDRNSDNKNLHTERSVGVGPTVK